MLAFLHFEGFKLRPVEPVGRWFAAFLLRQHRLGTSTSEENIDAKKSDAKPLETEGLVIEDDVEYLKKLDPRKWKASRSLFVLEFIRSRRLWSSLHGLGRIGAISQVTRNLGSELTRELANVPEHSR
jgi:hypothetical protein